MDVPSAVRGRLARSRYLRRDAAVITEFRSSQDDAGSSGIEKEIILPNEVMVKGTPIKSLLKFLDKELTSGQRDEVFRRVPPEIAERFGKTILATESFPVSLLNRLTATAAEVKGEPVLSFARRAGRAAAEDGVRGVYRAFVLVLTPASLISKAGRIWSTIYNAGAMEVDSPSECTAHIKLARFPSEEPGCARITGWIERLTEMTLVKDIRVEQIRCFAHGAEACEWMVTWK